MFTRKSVALFCFLFCVTLLGELTYSQTIPDEDWGYVTVRKGAHMFWWLYGMIDKTKRLNAPLVMWLQGGPGASSTGFGNFEEIGPLDSHLNPRPFTWINTASIIFVDNPVGAGFSYVDDLKLLTVNENQIATDLLTLFKAFLQRYPIFQGLPFYIFSESYGGKMASSFAQALHQAIRAGQIKCNFAGVALGDSWIKPIAFLKQWGPYLYTMSEIDLQGLQLIEQQVNLTSEAVESQNWLRATELWETTESVVEQVSAGVSFYNILDRSGKELRTTAQRPYQTKILHAFSSLDLDQLMNGPIRQKLKIIPNNVTWGGQSYDVFSALSVDFMQSVVPTVDWLLQNGVRVIVYSGNLDLICCTPGTLDWMYELKWNGLSKWNLAPRRTQMTNNTVTAFVKSYQNLEFWQILGAGHMVPSDQPLPALQFFTTVVTGKDSLHAD